jgi:hypothetical protein
LGVGCHEKHEDYKGQSDEAHSTTILVGFGLINAFLVIRFPNSGHYSRRRIQAAPQSFAPTTYARYADWYIVACSR